MNRNLDGCYFRVNRNNKYVDVCFSEIKEKEREEILSGRNTNWLKSLCCHLADSLKDIGEEFDIVGEN